MPTLSSLLPFALLLVVLFEVEVVIEGRVSLGASASPAQNKVAIVLAASF